MRPARHRLPALGLAALVAGVAGCGWMPGRPTAAERPVPPSKVTDFQALYAENCSGCHGRSGEASPAHPLDDPVYLAVVSDSVLKRVTANGIPGTLMPAFARSAGGELTRAQVETLVAGMRSRWARPGKFRGVSLPAYSETAARAAGSAPGDAARGRGVFGAFCAGCHGDTGKGGSKAGSVVDPAYLALVSDQALRTAVIAGRPRLGMPDWRHDVSREAMSDQEISDVVAWLASQRPAQGGSTQ